MLDNPILWIYQRMRLWLLRKQISKQRVELEANCFGGLEENYWKAKNSEDTSHFARVTALHNTMQSSRIETQMKCKTLNFMVKLHGNRSGQWWQRFCKSIYFVDSRLLTSSALWAMQTKVFTEFKDNVCMLMALSNCDRHEKLVYIK